VGGGDESPLRSARGDTSPLESGDVAVVLDLAEDGLDRVFSLAVKDASVVAGDHAAHEVITRSFAVLADALLGVLAVGWYEWPDASGGEVLDLAAGPVAGVGEQNVDLIADLCRGQFSDRGIDDGL